MDEAWRRPILTRLDVDQARREARRLSAAIGFDRGRSEAVALAVSELAMNLCRYAIGGEITLRRVADGLRRGVQVESQDAGPGIPDITLAFQDGYTTGGGLGSGLPSARRFMDDFELISAPSGTRIVARKWLTTRSLSV